MNSNYWFYYACFLSAALGFYSTAAAEPFDSETGFFLCEDDGRKHVDVDERCRRGLGGGVPLSGSILDTYINWRPSETFFVRIDQVSIKPVCQYSEGITCTCANNEFSLTDFRPSIPSVLLRVIEDQRSLRSSENRLKKIQQENNGEAPESVISSFERLRCRHAAYALAFDSEYQSSLAELIENYRNKMDAFQRIQVEYGQCDRFLSASLKRYLDKGNSIVSDKEWIAELKDQEKCQRGLKKMLNSARKDKNFTKDFVAHWLTYAINYPERLVFTEGQDYQSQLWDL